MKKFNGRGVIGRGVTLRSGDPTASSSWRSTVCAVRVAADGAKFYRVADRAARYHSFEYMRTKVLSAKVMRKMPLEYQLAYLERMLRPPIVRRESPWFPAKALRFVREDYTTELGAN